MEPGRGLSQACHQQISVRNGPCARSKFLAHQQGRDDLEELPLPCGHEKSFKQPSQQWCAQLSPVLAHMQKQHQG